MQKKHLRLEQNGLNNIIFKLNNMDNVIENELVTDLELAEQAREDE